MHKLLSADNDRTNPYCHRSCATKYSNPLEKQRTKKENTKHFGKRRVPLINGFPPTLTPRNIHPRFYWSWTRLPSASFRCHPPSWLPGVRVRPHRSEIGIMTATRTSSPPWPGPVQLRLSGLHRLNHETGSLRGERLVRVRCFRIVKGFSPPGLEVVGRDGINEADLCRT